MSAQLVVGPNSSASLIRTTSAFTVDDITTNGLSIGTTISVNGSMDIGGSLGVTGDINATGEFQLDGSSVLTNTTLGSGVVNSSLTSLGTLTSLLVSGNVNLDGNTLVVDSTNNNVGINTTPNVAYSLDVSGDTNIDGNVTVTGDLTVDGVLTTFATVSSSITQTFLKLAEDNGNDIVDTGVYNLYNDGVSKYAGYFRDATDKRFKFFEGSQVEPSTTIDTGATGYSLANVEVDTLYTSNIDVSTLADIQDLNVTGEITSTDITINTNTLVSDSGNNRIGISNATPSYTLDVGGDTNTSGVYRLDGTEVLSNNSLGTGITSSNLQVLGNLESLNIVGNLTVDTNTLLVNSTTNRVGINNSTPSYPLDINGNVNTTETYNVDGVEVLSGTTLGSGVVNSSLTNVGILTSLEVSGDLTVDTNTLSVNSSTSQIGVGTTNPSNKLHVSEDNSLATQQLTLENQSLLGSAGLEITHNSNTSTISQETDAFRLSASDKLYYMASDVNGQHLFFTSGVSEARMAILENGQVGIGTTNTNYSLDVSGDINFSETLDINGTEIISSTGITTTNQTLHLNSSDKIMGNTNNIQFYTNNTLQTNLDENGNINLINGNIGIGTSNPLYYLSLGVSNLGISTSNANTEMTFYTEGVERLRIDNTGKLGVKNTNPQYTIDIFGDINFTGQLYQNSSPFILPDGIWIQNDSHIYNSNSGNVGIGITEPTQKLDVVGNTNISGNLTVDTNVLYVDSSNNRVGVNRTPSYELDVNGNARIGSSGEEAKIGYVGHNDWAGFAAANFATSGGYCLIQNNSSGEVILNRPSGQSMYFRRNNSNDMLINSSGYIGMGQSNPLGRLHVKATNNDDGGSLGNYNRACIIMEGSNSSAKWAMSINNTADELIFSYNLADRGYLRNEANVGAIDFTGQHRSRFSENNDTYLENIENYIGMIVCSTGLYSEDLTINQALPFVELSTIQNDKKCYGVISEGEDINDDTRRYEVGVFGTVVNKEEGDNRVIINSVGEGGIWVCNENGPLENGDYITTSNNKGYGMKQNDDLLHNYTVAKITCNEDFSDMTNGRVLSNGIKCKFVGCTYHCG